MSDTAAPAGRTGRRSGGNNPPPAEAQPEDTAAVAEGEAEIGSTGGIYFAKAPKQEVYHCYTPDHEPIGRAVLDQPTAKWKIFIGRELREHVFTSSTAARAYLLGYFEGGEARHGGAGPVREAVPGDTVTTATGAVTGRPDGGFDASTATVTSA